MDITSHGTTAETSRTLIDRVRETATTQLTSQKSRATDSLGNLARAVRETSEPLRNNQQDALAGLVERAADGIERFSGQLRDRDLNELVDDVQQYARRQPALFIGAAFAVGVMAARFLKSSSPAASRPYDASRTERTYAYGGGSYGGSGTGFATGGV